MVDIWFERDAFARLEPQYLSSLDDGGHSVDLDLYICIGKTLLIVCLPEFHAQVTASSVDDVLHLLPMEVDRSHLTHAYHHDLFAVCLIVELDIAVPDGHRCKTDFFKITCSEIGNIPTETVSLDLFTFRTLGLPLLVCPVKPLRQVEVLARKECAGFLDVGMLVWQEFPLACNNYPDDPHYLSVLRQEAEYLVQRLRNHPCLAMWCGGNELFNSWSGMTDQSLALRMLNAVCYENSPEIPFIATSPLNGMGHGHYLFYWEGEDVFQRMNSAHLTAYTEFGLPGISPKEVLENIIPAEDLFPPRQGTAWETHHAFGAWDGAKDTWISTSIMNRYFREPESLDELIELSSIMQGEGYKAIFEESRRQKPYCSMALNWMFCEPWPSAANNSLIVYPAHRKPALEDVRMACRPVCSSLRFERFDWKEGQMFECELWMLNDTAECLNPYEATVFVEADGQVEEILSWKSVRSSANANVKGPVARFLLPKWNTDRFSVRVRVKDHPEMDSCYILAYKQKKARTGVATAMNMDVES